MSIKNIFKNKTYQFELWEECNSKCSFCYLGKNNIQTPSEEKISNIQAAIDTIEDGTIFNKYGINCLGFIGGEFFQGQLKDKLVKEAFIKLMVIVNDLLNKKTLNNIWIAASLLIGDQTDLYEVLDIFKENIEKVWIASSYDTFGRFHSEKQKTEWFNNIINLKKIYQGLNVNTTAIVTGDFIDKYLSNNIDLFPFADKYNMSVFLKPPCKFKDYRVSKEDSNIEIPNFFPTRDQMLRFLYAYKQNETELAGYLLFNIGLRAEYLQLYGHRHHFSHRYKDYVEVADDNPSLLGCKHSQQYQCYVDSDKCVICDKEKIFGDFEL